MDANDQANRLARSVVDHPARFNNFERMLGFALVEAQATIERLHDQLAEALRMDRVEYDEEREGRDGR